ncbi:hypothetical protein ALC56_13474 [Trachymyrmex septentrionalis]|uniref:Uncharacterized protein n=1 Tax=Trachymyrmex septentrionalis TaxID=34720 RepID=A0A195EVC1_9HYME|nr:hypothetical protein ALC56_13474 [Trachymyrmex septentrionalis]
MEDINDRGRLSLHTSNSEDIIVSLLYARCQTAVDLIRLCILARLRAENNERLYHYLIGRRRKGRDDQPCSRPEPARSNRSLKPAMAISPAQTRRKRDSEGSDRGNDQVEEEGRGLKAALGSNDSSQNNPAYKLDCWWDMETERGQSREDRRGYMCNSETGSIWRLQSLATASVGAVGMMRMSMLAAGHAYIELRVNSPSISVFSMVLQETAPESGSKRKVEISGSLDLQSSTISCELSDVPLRSFAAAPNSTTERLEEKDFTGMSDKNKLGSLAHRFHGERSRIGNYPIQPAGFCRNVLSGRDIYRVSCETKSCVNDRQSAGLTVFLMVADESARIGSVDGGHHEFQAYEIA